MVPDHLRTIQRLTVVLGVTATAASGLLWGVRGMFAAAVGAATAALNFWALRRLGSRAIARITTGGSASQISLLVTGLVVKMLLLFGFIWLIVQRAGLPALPFTLGLSAVVLSILFAGAPTSLAAEAPQTGRGK